MADMLWAVEDKTSGSRVGYSGRMTAFECRLFLCGMIEGAEQKQKRWEDALHETTAPVHP